MYPAWEATVSRPANTVPTSPKTCQRVDHTVIDVHDPEGGSEGDAEQVLHLPLI